MRALGRHLGMAWIVWSFAAAAASPVAAGTPIALVVSDRWSVEGITPADLREAFLGGLVTLGTRRVVPVDQSATSPVYDGFRHAVLGRSRRSLEDFWLEQALSGAARPPRQFSTVEAAIAYVARTPGAITYLRAADVARFPGVRVLSLLLDGGPADPSDEGYRLSYEP